MVIKYKNVKFKTNKIIKYTGYINHLFFSQNLYKNSTKVNLKNKILMKYFDIDYDELRRILKELNIIVLKEKETYEKSQRYSVDYSKNEIINKLCKCIESEYSINKTYILNHSVKIDLLELYVLVFHKKYKIDNIDYSNKHKRTTYNNILTLYYTKNVKKPKFNYSI